MKIYKYGNDNASVVLVQPVDDHDMKVIENEVRLIGKLTDTDFLFMAVKVDKWNADLSPWSAPAVFGNERFGGGGAVTLEKILNLCTDESRTYYIGGYSLAGLFALWSAYRTDRFYGVAAASPSMWFPGFTDYIQEHDCKSKSVYLSLGDKEDKTRNPVMRTVGECIRSGYELLRNQGIQCILEWNEGNHFMDPDIRTAKAFAWVMNNELKNKGLITKKRQP